MTWGAYNATYTKCVAILQNVIILMVFNSTQQTLVSMMMIAGIWKPKDYTGTYGSNGCYLDFEIHLI